MKERADNLGEQTRTAHHETESRAYDIKDTAAALIYNNTKRRANDVHENGKVGTTDIRMVMRAFI